MSTHRCLRCNGSKKYAPLGGMYHPCPYCKGVGHVIANEGKPDVKAMFDEAIAKRINDPNVQPITIVSKMPPDIEPVAKKKPGRKKGWNKPAPIQAPSENANI